MSNSNMDMEAYLYCIHCNGETQHKIHYRNNQISQIKCNTCGVEVRIDQDYVEKHIKEEFIRRVLTKPIRITKEMEKDLTGFLVSLPYRVVTKPYRMYKEFKE